ncbi:MAG: PDZ domain-containing protein [Tepidisphaerales bacterium]
MFNPKNKEQRTKNRVAGVILFLALCLPAFAEYPLLEQLNQQTQSLYNEVQSGIVRVQLPVPLWAREAAAKNDPLRKWDKVVDGNVRQVIDDRREASLRGSAGGKLNVRIVPSTQPSTQSAAGNVEGLWVSRRTETGEIVLESRGDRPGALVINAGSATNPSPGAPLRLRVPPAGTFAPNNLGLVLDDAGHVLVPVYIEKEAIGQAPVRMMIGNEEATATFVGSDEKTQVTILKMNKRIGRPLKLTGVRPADGSLVMLLNPTGAAGKLALWTGGEREYGVVVALDGTICGIIRYGQFLAGSASKPVIDQLIKLGTVQRAILGARLTEIRADDPARRQLPQLADRPALMIDEVTPGSLAERAGLQRGDFILEMGSEPVGDLTTWAALSARGGQTTLTVLRGEQTQRVSINLAPENR